MSRKYPIQVEENLFTSDESGETNGIIQVYEDSHLYNCELYGVFAQCHPHKRHEVCKCANWSNKPVTMKDKVIRMSIADITREGDKLAVTINIGSGEITLFGFDEVREFPLDQLLIMLKREENE